MGRMMDDSSSELTALKSAGVSSTQRAQNAYETSNLGGTYEATAVATETTHLQASSTLLQEQEADSSEAPLLRCFSAL